MATLDLPAPFPVNIGGGMGERDPDPEHIGKGRINPAAECPAGGAGKHQKNNYRRLHAAG